MDAAVLDRARTGDRAALAAVLEDVAPAVARFARAMCKNGADAEDTVQDTLIAVARNLPNFEGRSSLSSWAFTLARTACSRRRRGKKNQPALGMDALAELASSADLDRDQERAELGRQVQHALAGLPEDYREVVWLRDVEGLTAIEAAEALGISVDALKSRLHRARGALKQALAGVLDAAPTPAGPQPAAAPCPDIAQQLSTHLEGDLSAIDCQSMQEHLAACPRCSATCDVLKDALALCGRAPRRQVSADVQARVREAIRALLDAQGATGAT